MPFQKKEVKMTDEPDYYRKYMKEYNYRQMPLPCKNIFCKSKFKYINYHKHILTKKHKHAIQEEIKNLMNSN